MKLVKGVTFSIILTYTFFGFLFWHFAKEMLQVKSSGWFVGQVNLYGDLVYHLALINKFIEANSILVDSPIFAGDKINYPIFADYITSLITRLTGVDFALFFTTLLGGFIVIAVLHLFIRSFVKNDIIVFLTLLLFFTNGGFGFYYFFQDFGASQKTFSEFIFSLPREYTDLKDLGYWWINPYLAYFLPQRGFLFAFPITLTVLLLLYRGYQNSKPLYFLLAGILSGTLALVQAHSLFVIFLLSAYYALLSIYLKKNSYNIIYCWVLFAASTAIIAYPLFKIISSVGNPFDYIRFDPGWTSDNNSLWQSDRLSFFKNLFWFWFKNLGVFAPTLVVSVIWLFKTNRKLFSLYIPFLFIFLISNVWIFQPWEFDNSKLLIYWYFASCFVVGYFIYDTFFSTRFIKTVPAIILIFVMIFSSAIDIFRTFTTVSSYQIYSSNDLEIANQVKLLTPANTVFTTASNHNHPIPTLTGRSTVIGFHGWIWSHGSDYVGRADEVSQIYQGGEPASELIKKRKVYYVTVGPQEISEFDINTAYFRSFPQVNLDQDWVLYDVSSLWSNGNWQD